MECPGLANSKHTGLRAGAKQTGPEQRGWRDRNRVCQRHVGLRIEGHAQFPGLPSPFTPNCPVQLPGPECPVHTLTVGATVPARPVFRGGSLEAAKGAQAEVALHRSGPGEGERKQSFEKYPAAVTVLEGLTLSPL